MLGDQMLKLFESAGIDPKTFDHFDYAEGFQTLKQNFNSVTERSTKKKKVIEQFIQKAHQKIIQDNPHFKKQKINNFMQRMQKNQRLQQQKLQALRFIKENYDEKSKQLWFYPNSNRKKQRRMMLRESNFQSALSASRNYQWQLEQSPQKQQQIIETQRPIMSPNLSEQYRSRK